MGVRSASLSGVNAAGGRDPDEQMPRSPSREQAHAERKARSQQRLGRSPRPRGALSPSAAARRSALASTSMSSSESPASRRLARTSARSAPYPENMAGSRSGRRRIPSHLEVERWTRHTHTSGLGVERRPSNRRGTTRREAASSHFLSTLPKIHPWISSRIHVTSSSGSPQPSPPSERARARGREGGGGVPRRGSRCRADSRSEERPRIGSDAQCDRRNQPATLTFTTFDGWRVRRPTKIDATRQIVNQTQRIASQTRRRERNTTEREPNAARDGAPRRPRRPRGPSGQTRRRRG